MRKNGLNRRCFLSIAAASPFAVTIGCSKEEDETQLTEDALRILVLAIGPWGLDKRAEADDFAARFLRATGVSGPFLSQSTTLRGLADQAPFRDHPMAIDSLDLAHYSAAEKKLLTSLTTRIYGLFEVHYHHVAGMPDVGNCAGREWYTRAPSDW